MKISQGRSVPAEMQSGAVRDSTDSTPADGTEDYSLSMGDSEEADYDGVLSGDVTELAPSASVTEAHTAWALDDGPEWKPPRFSPAQVTAMAVAAAIALIAGAGVIAWTNLRGPAETATAAVSTTATSSVVAKPSFWPKPTKTVPLPPATVTVTAPPPPPVTKQVAIPPQAAPTAPSVIAGLIPYNERFLTMIQQRGWAIWDRNLMLERAHSTCSMLRDGENPDLIASKLMGVEAQLNWQMAVQFVGTVRDAYPNCS